MGSVDFGTQSLVFDYSMPAKAEEFNKLFYNILPHGIYEGGELTFVNNSPATISISPFSAIVLDTVTGIAVKISTSASVVLRTGFPVAGITIDNAHPFIVARFTWVNTEDNYLDILAIPFAEIQNSDIVIGRCIYESGILQEDFDLTRRTNASISLHNNESFMFNVTSTEPASDIVNVSAGNFNDGLKTVTISNITSDVVSATPTTLKRIDLVYINSLGQAKIVEGVAHATSPVTPDYGSRFVIAEIHRDVNRSIIVGSDIINIAQKNKFNQSIYLDTDITLSANSDFRGASQKALKTYIDTVVDNRLAVGMTYVQYPGQSTPESLFQGTWENISNLYASGFFRAEGSYDANHVASAFESGPQFDSNKLHTHIWSQLSGYYKGRSDDDSHSGVHGYEDFIYSNYNINSSANSVVVTGSNANEGSSEAKPINFTIRIWKRIA